MKILFPDHGELTANPDISLATKGLYVYLALLPELEIGYLTPDILITQLHERPTVILNCLRELKEAGFLEIDEVFLKASSKKDPDIDEVLAYFEGQILDGGDLPRVMYQRRAAHTLLLKKGKTKVLQAIDAVALARDERFAPHILSVEQLRDKWNSLVDFYRRNGLEMKRKKDTAAQIRKMTGGDEKI